MTPPNRGKPPLTPEEARLLDGTLSDEARAALEAQLAEDPARAKALAGDRAAMALWKDDARAQAEGIDVGALAEQVVASVKAGRVAAPRLTFPRAYAVAAMLLIAIGAVGTLVTRSGASPAASVPSAIEASLIEAIADDPALWLGEAGGR